MPTRPSSLIRSWRVVLAVLIASTAVLVAILVTNGSGGQAGGETTQFMPTSARIEQEYGVRFTLVAVTADGGLVDVRFVVLDPEAALEIVESETQLPNIVTSRNDRVLPSAAMMPMEHVLTVGRTYSVLYRNTAGAVRVGDEVALVFPDARLPHVIAQ